MPNWCRNHLRVTGPEGEVQKFIDTFKTYPPKWGDEEEDEIAKEKRFSLHGLVPAPENILKEGYDKGCDWCWKNWGTKWDIKHIVVNNSERHNEFDIKFETAWEPPIPAIKTASKKFPKLEFWLQYYELGLGFAGRMIVKGGNIVEAIEVSIDRDLEEYRTFMLEEIGIDPFH